MTLILNFYANRNKVEIVSCLEQETKMNDFVFFKDTTTITWAGKKKRKTVSVSELYLSKNRKWKVR